MTKTKTAKNELKEATDVATAEVVEETEELDYSPFLYIFSLTNIGSLTTEPFLTRTPDG